MLNRKIRVLHLLASNRFSGAENMVCQIISMFDQEIEMAYCSPKGDISSLLEDKGIKFFELKKLTPKQVRMVIDEFNPDIIHAHDIKASIVATMVKKDVPIVSHIHGSDSVSMGKLTLKSFLFNLFTRKINHIFWVSRSCLDTYRFKHKVASKSSILYNIISLDDLYSKANMITSKENFDIAYLGRLEPVKNPLRMLNIIKCVVEENKDLRVVVMGDGSLIEDCNNFVECNKLQSNVQFKGFLKNPYGTLKNCKLLLMSSISEGTPMCVLEALALGVPVVSTPTDGVADIVVDGETGFLYSDDLTAKEKIMEILNSSENYHDNCVKWAKRFNDIAKYKESIESVYFDLINKNSNEGKNKENK